MAYDYLYARLRVGTTTLTLLIRPSVSRRALADTKLCPSALSITFLRLSTCLVKVGFFVFVLKGVVHLTSSHLIMFEGRFQQQHCELLIDIAPDQRIALR
jgi:hypothetical protein